jgi:mannosyl-oligosaccharide alpha-1,3-glucosidase
MKKTFLLLVAIIALIHLTDSADKELFKTCEQSSFCRRCRKFASASNYELLPDTLYNELFYIEADVRNNENSHLFMLKIEALKVKSDRKVERSYKFSVTGWNFPITN